MFPDCYHSFPYWWGFLANLLCNVESQYHYFHYFVFYFRLLHMLLLLLEVFLLLLFGNFLFTILKRQAIRFDKALSLEISGIHTLEANFNH